jgi:hypothetical protein
LMTGLSLYFMPVQPQSPFFGMMSNPVMSVVFQFVITILMALALNWVGQMAGGSGQIEDVLLALTWVQVVLICLQILQTLALFLYPPIAFLIGIAGLGLTFYLMSAFFAELSGFPSVWRAFFLILLTAFAMTLLLALILTMMGLSLDTIA